MSVSTGQRGGCCYNVRSVGLVLLLLLVFGASFGDAYVNLFISKTQVKKLLGEFFVDVCMGSTYLFCCCWEF